MAFELEFTTLSFYQRESCNRIIRTNEAYAINLAFATFFSSSSVCVTVKNKCLDYNATLGIVILLSFSCTVNGKQKILSDELISCG